MTTETLPSHGMSSPKFYAAMVFAWLAATGFVFPLAWLLRQVSIPHGTGYWSYLLLVLLGFPFFYWIAKARWPSSSSMSRFGFAAGTAVINCALAMSSAFAIGTFIYGG